MKRFISLIAVLCICLALCACGSTSEKAAPEGMESILPGQSLTQGTSSAGSTDSKTADEDVDYDALAEIAEKLYQKNVSEMYERLGEPNSKETAPSCLGKGTDGVYTYNNIIVTTYSEGTEVIYSVSVVDNNGEEVYCVPES